MKVSSRVREKLLSNWRENESRLEVKWTYGFDVRCRGEVIVLYRVIKWGVMDLSWSVMQSRSCQRKVRGNDIASVIKRVRNEIPVRCLDLIWSSVKECMRSVLLMEDFGKGVYI